MDDSDISTIAAWLTEQGLKGTSESELLSGFCASCREAGLPLDRGMALMDTLHPVYEGRAFRWDSEAEVESEFEYGPSGQGEALDNWQRSAFYYLWSGNENEVRRRIGFGDPADFILLDKMLEAGHTDFVALVHRFAKEGTIGEMDCFFSHFTTKHPEGFSDQDLSILRKLVPMLALAIKCIALGRIARTIAEVYLGEDAARQVTGRQDQPRQIRADFGSALVLRSSELHQDIGQRTAGRNPAAAQRIWRSGDFGDP